MSIRAKSLALVSLPDFNPNATNKNFNADQMNQMMSGVFELGSVIKAITFAMALRLWHRRRSTSRYRCALSTGHRPRRASTISTPTRRVLTVPEIFTNSSNIGTARMALEVGIERHQEFLRRVGLFDRLLTEVPESAKPLLPQRWGRLVTATAAFGHGFAVQPLQGAAVVAGLLNGGKMITPTFLKRDRADGRGAGDAASSSPRPARCCAICSASMRSKARAQQGRCARLSRRRQDRHGREGRQRPLSQEPST